MKGPGLTLAPHNAWLRAVAVDMSVLVTLGCGIRDGNICALFSEWEGKSQTIVVGAGTLGEGAGRYLGKVSIWYF